MLFFFLSAQNWHLVLHRQPVDHLFPYQECLLPPPSSLNKQPLLFHLPLITGCNRLEANSSKPHYLLGE